MNSLSSNQFFALIFLILLYTTAQARPVATFYKLPTNDSIKNTSSFCVFQDSKGIIWIGTTNGLVRYNSSTVTIYRNNPDQSSSLQSNIVRDIAEGSENILWLATINGGLISFDTKNEIFQQYNKFVDSQLWTIMLDKSGKSIWLGGLRSGLSKFDIETKKVTNYDLHYKNGDPLTKINAIYQADNYLLLGTGHGVFKFDPENITLSKYKPKILTGIVFDIKLVKNGTFVAAENGVFFFGKNDHIEQYYSTNTSAIAVDSQKRLFAGLWGKGLSISNINSTTRKLLSHIALQEKSLPSNNIWDITITKDNMVFVATKDGTVIFNPEALKYNFYDRIWLNPQNNNPLFANSVFSDSNGNLWIGANNNIILYKKHSNSIQQWRKDNFVPIDFIESSDGTIWVADQKSQGLMIVTKQYPSLKLVVAPTKNNSCCSGISTLLKNNDGSIWAGLNGSGIVRYNTDNNTFSDFNLKNTFVNIIERLDDHNLLVGSYGGLYIFNENNNNVSLINNTKGRFIFDIWRAKSGILYIATDDGLLNLTRTTEGVLTAKNVNAFKDKRRVIFSILEADNGDLWLGTGSALARYRPSTGKSYLLTHEQGVPIQNFFRNSAARSKTDSTLFFGGPNGVISFSPSDILINRTVPNVLIAGIDVLLENEHKQYSINKNIEIPYNLKTLELQFYSLDYRTPATPPHYAYALKGFNNELTYTHLNKVSFTNLDPGTYTFKIKAANSFGEWGDDFTELTFTVLTPWWMSWWAYTLYAIIALAILGLLFWYQHRRLLKERSITTQLREAENLREHFVQELEGQVSSATSDFRDSMEALQIKTVELEVANKRAQDTTQLKSQFLANISHELRTPMNGILGFVDLLNRTKLGDKQRDYVTTIRRSSESLVDIINNVLDISKIEAGKITLDVAAFNLRDCIESTLSLLAPIAYEKQLELCCIIEPDLPTQLRGDPARLRQILINLLGNAIKFTQTGTVSIRVMTSPGTNLSHQKPNFKDDAISITIAISDTGIGIAPDHMERLFTSFSQATPGIERRFGGTGLGLSLSKMLVKAMHGKIDLQSTPNVGTIVKVELPLVQDASQQDWIVDEKLSGNTVLLYDEHPLCTQGFVFLLQSWGMQVIETSNAKEWQAELERHGRQPRYAAFVIALGAQQTGKAKKIVKSLCGKQTNLPLLIMASTLDLNILYRLETGIGAPCLSRHAGSRMVHNTLLTLLDDQSQFSRTARKFSENATLAGLRVLIADDNTANRELLRHMLRQNGAHTAETVDGRETLDRLRAVDGADNKPWDLLLLDIHMPNVSGLEVIARIRDDKAGSPTLPVIAVTANAMPEMRQWAVACGMDGYIIKPFTEEKLLEEIQRVLPVSNENERQ